MKSIAIIPALSGSKRIPDKEILLIDGHPLASYSARMSQKAGFDQVILSSDNESFKNLTNFWKTDFHKRKPEVGGLQCSQCGGKRCTNLSHLANSLMEESSCRRCSSCIRGIPADLWFLDASSNNDEKRWIFEDHSESARNCAEWLGHRRFLRKFDGIPSRK
jgi:hypothetical protein